MGWIGVDFDGVLATYVSGQWPAIGEPIQAMVNRVKKWIAEGKEVRIVTARVCSKQKEAVRVDQQLQLMLWLVKNGIHNVRLTAEKDYEMEVLYDDRAVQVEQNTGRLLSQQPEFRTMTDVPKEVRR